jgi:predicted nucleic acid-binding protein
MAGVVVLDAGALIALYSNKDEHHTWAMQMFRDTSALELEMNALTFAEALGHPTRAGKAKKFLSNTSGLGLKIKTLDEDAAIEIAKLRSNTSLKMPDAVVLHQALVSKGSLATTDKLLARVAQGLKISVYHPFQPRSTKAF